MKRWIIARLWIAIILSSGLLVISCNGQTSGSSQDQKSPAHLKPPGTFQDSLLIDSKSAVFYEPDSLQLEKIMAKTDEKVYNSSMHEYYYQVRNAHIVLKKEWPDVTVIDAKKVRFLVFLKANGQREIIDLDQKDDSYGMFVFEPKKSPRLIDMTNVENQVPDYFSN